MTVYVDQPRLLRVLDYRDRYWCHLWAPSAGELLTFAARLGMPAGWMHRDHFDIAETYRAAAVRAGALEVTNRELARMRRESRTGPGRPA